VASHRKAQPSLNSDVIERCTWPIIAVSSILLGQQPCITCGAAHCWFLLAELLNMNIHIDVVVVVPQMVKNAKSLTLNPRSSQHGQNWRKENDVVRINLWLLLLRNKYIHHVNIYYYHCCYHYYSYFHYWLIRSAVNKCVVYIFMRFESYYMKPFC